MSSFAARGGHRSFWWVNSAFGIVAVDTITVD